MLKHNNVSVDVERFASEYVRQEVLFERPYYKRNKVKVLEAYQKIALHCSIGMREVAGLEEKFRAYVDRKMYALVRCGVRSVEELPAQFAWLRQAVEAFGILPEILKGLSIWEAVVDRSSETLIRALSTQALVRGSDADIEMFDLVRGRFTLSCTSEELRSIWEKAKRLALENIKLSGSYGDDVAVDAETAMLGDVALLTNAADVDVLGEDEPPLPQAEARCLLLDLVQKYNLEEEEDNPPECESAQRWSHAYYEYTAGSRWVSIVVLQYRWHALKLRSRYKLLNYWRTTRAPEATVNGQPRELACSDRPNKLHVAIISRYPHVALAEQMATWREVVERGDVITAPLPKEDILPTPPSNAPGEQIVSDSNDDIDGPIANRDVPSVRHRRGALSTPPIPTSSSHPTPPVPDLALPTCSHWGPPAPLQTNPSPLQTNPSPCPAPRARAARVLPSTALHVSTSEVTHNSKLYKLEEVNPEGQTSGIANPSQTHPTQLSKQAQNRKRSAEAASALNTGTETPLLKIIKSEPENDLEYNDTYSSNVPCIVKTEIEVTLKNMKQETQYEIENEPYEQSELMTHGERQDQKWDITAQRPKSMADRIVFADDDDEVIIISDDENDEICDVKPVINSYVPMPRVLINPSHDSRVENDQSDVSQPDPANEIKTERVSEADNDENLDAGNEYDPASEIKTERVSEADSDEDLDAGNEYDPASEVKTERVSEADSDEDLDAANEYDPASEINTETNNEASNEADSDAANEYDPASVIYTETNSEPGSDAEVDADNDAETTPTNQRLVESAIPGVEVATPRVEESGLRPAVRRRRRPRMSIAQRSLGQWPVSAPPSRRPAPALMHRMGMNRDHEIQTLASDEPLPELSGQALSDVTMSLEQVLPLLNELTGVAMARAVLDREEPPCCAARTHRNVSEARARLNMPPPPPHVHADGAECKCCCRQTTKERRAIVTARREELSRIMAAMFR